MLRDQNKRIFAPIGAKEPAIVNFWKQIKTNHLSSNLTGFKNPPGLTARLNFKKSLVS